MLSMIQLPCRDSSKNAMDKLLTLSEHDFKWKSHKNQLSQFDKLLELKPKTVVNPL